MWPFSIGYQLKARFHTDVSTKLEFWVWQDWKVLEQMLLRTKLKIGNLSMQNFKQKNEGAISLSIVNKEPRWLSISKFSYCSMLLKLKLWWVTKQEIFIFYFTQYQPTGPIWTFYVTQSFLSRDPFGFWSLGYPGVQGRVCGHACVKNLPRIGGEVCAKFGGDWSGGLGT